ncbi:unnamed protein product, partial [Didymodactylos carnosus]
MDYDGGRTNPSSSSTIPSLFPFNMLNFPPTNNNPLINRYPSNNQSSSTPPNLADLLFTLNGNSNLSSQQQQSDDNNLSINSGDMNNFTSGLSEEDDSWVDIENWMADENKIKQEQQ